jgi:hypothetical protein
MGQRCQRGWAFGVIIWSIMHSKEKPEGNGIRLIDKLITEAEARGLVDPNLQVDLATAFRLVRDMAYQRATDRRPDTLIREWRGTCSGKHYLLKALYEELGYKSQVIACTSIDAIDEDKVPEEIHDLWAAAGRRFVDVHNYLVLDSPEGEMVVDATWPVGNGKYGLKVNEEFVLGQDQQIACTPIQSWVVPDDRDPQSFKEQLLLENFTQQELAFRDAFIIALSEWLSTK